MAAPKGNKNGKGKKGKSGRKSAYFEKQDADWTLEKWETDTNVPELQKKIATKEYSVRDVFLYEALTGNTKVLNTFANKMLPDLHDIRGRNGGAIEIDLVGEAKKRSEKYL